MIYQTKRRETGYLSICLAIAAKRMICLRSLFIAMKFSIFSVPELYSQVEMIICTSYLNYMDAIRAYFKL